MRLTYNEMCEKYGFDFWIQDTVLVVVNKNLLYEYYCLECGNRVDHDGMVNTYEEGYYERTVYGNCKQCGKKCEY